MSEPRGLAYDGNTGLLYITELGTHCIAVMDPATGLLVRKIGSGKGRNLGQLNWPQCMALDAFGNLLVVEFQNRRVMVFNACDGTPLSCFPTPQYPRSVFVDVKGDVLVGGTEFLCKW